MEEIQSIENEDPITAADIAVIIDTITHSLTICNGDDFFRFTRECRINVLKKCLSLLDATKVKL